MKKSLFFLGIVLMLASCAQQKRITLLSVTDFRQYTNTNFYISPDPYPGKFQPLGMVYVDIYPAQMARTKKTMSRDDVYDHGSFVQEKITDQELLKELTDKAKELGADGLADFKSFAHYKVVQQTGAIIYEHYTAEGLAIKRE